MRKQAPPRHYNDLRESTKREYDYYWRDVERAAQTAGVPLYAPGDAFLENYLEQEATISPRRARMRLVAIAYHFALQGLPDPTAALPIRKALYIMGQAPRHRRDDLLALVPSAVRPFAAYFVDGQYAETSRTQWLQRGHSWEIWADRHGVDPHDPPPSELVRYLQGFPDRAFTTYLNLLNGLRHYFVDRHLPDVTKCEEVQLFMEGKRRVPGRLMPPLFLDDMRRIAAVFGNDKLDKRDHFTTLLGFFGPLTSNAMAVLNCNDVRIEREWLIVRSAAREYCLDRYPQEPLLDLGRAYERYIASVDWRAGRLFRALGLRGEYLSQISPGALSTGVNHAGAHAGIAGGHILERLRKGFRIQATLCFGTIATAHHLGVTPAALAKQVPSARIEREQIENAGMRRQRSGRGQRKRNPATGRTTKQSSKTPKR